MTRLAFALACGIAAYGTPVLLEARPVPQSQGRVPPSIRAAEPPGKPPKEVRDAQCAELRAIVEVLEKDSPWLAQSRSASELRHLKKALNDLDCGGMTGTFRLEGPGPRDYGDRGDLKGTMTVQRIDSDLARKLAAETPFPFAVHGCVGPGPLVAYEGTVTWDPGSYFARDVGWFRESGVPSVGTFLVCGQTDGQLVGSLRDGASRGDPSGRTSGTVASFALYQRDGKISGNIHRVQMIPIVFHLVKVAGEVLP
jgi:hypothetical protein